MDESKAFDAWEKEARQRAVFEAKANRPNMIIERREELRQSGMDADQIDAAIKKEFKPEMKRGRGLRP